MWLAPLSWALLGLVTVLVLRRQFARRRAAARPRRVVPIVTYRRRTAA